MEHAQRLASIDALRALTMLLMIFVIDLWSLSDIPAWLDHAAAEEDRMGLADVVFPLFMFIIGLAIPPAIDARLANAARKVVVLKHIVLRAVSLILMGFLVVNLDNMNDQSMLLQKNTWQLLMVIAVVLIWNDYGKPRVLGGISKIWLQLLGWIILLGLITVYQGQNQAWMRIHWWGILGLLGWAYGVCAVIYLLGKTHVWLMGLSAVVFLALNVNELAGNYPVRLVISASNYFCVMLGVFVAALFRLYAPSRRSALVYGLIGAAMALLAFGFSTRPLWEISKIRATPSWATICGGISILCFLALVIIADIKKAVAWLRPVAPAGYATLTCYFALYFVYAVMHLAGWQWPGSVTVGAIGLLKSFLFALLVIQITGFAARFHIKLRI